MRVPRSCTQGTVSGHMQSPHTKKRIQKAWDHKIVSLVVVKGLPPLKDLKLNIQNEVNSSLNILC